MKWDEKREIKDIASQVIDAYLSGVSPGEGSSFNPATLLKIRRLVEEVSSGGLVEELSKTLNVVAENLPDIGNAALAWIDLVRVLVEHTEGRYKGSHKGALKASEVKSVLLYLLKIERVHLPGIPSYIEPIIGDLGADIAIRIIVTLANANGIFIDTSRRHSFRDVLLWPLYWLANVTRPLWRPLLRLASRIWIALRYHAPISPVMRGALAEIERQGVLPARGDLEKQFQQVILWSTTHEQVLDAGIKLVTIVVQETEQFVHLNGRAKKAYASDLVIAVMDELGVSHGLLVSAGVRVVVSIAIDMVVHLFKQWSIFPEGSGQGAMIGAPPPDRRVLQPTAGGTVR